ncbi:MAG TPA: hypothetical protein PLQ88_27050, partial [Blastocatellia bacterium]|nr:hypothetical protein [Blastocatellia bacterium]
MVALALALTFSLSGVNAQKGTAEFDVQHYKIDAELIPAEQLLKARAEVRFVPQTDTRSVVFEMNGSLAIKSIRRADAPPAATTAAAAAPQASTPVRTPVTDAKTKAVKEVVKPAAAKTAPAKSGQPAKAGLKEEAVKEVPSDPNELQFIQDARENMNVRVDLGTVAPARQPLTLVFEYQGALESAQGGPINNARLAFVGDSGSYLFYAARWFPFHEYAADRSTYEISLKVPKEVLVAGYSEQPVVPVPSVDPTSKAEFSTYSFVSTKPLLPGNFAAGKYII